MPISVSCSQCGKQYRKIPEKYSGRRIQCRDCDGVIEIPNPRSARRTASTRRRRSVETEAAASAENHSEKKSSPRRKKKKQGGWTLTRIYFVLFVLVCLGTWGEMAASYARDVEGWVAGSGVALEVDGARFRRHRSAAIALMIASMLDFTTNAFAQLPRLPQVFSHTFTQAWGVLIVFVLVQAVLACALCVMKGLELKMEQDARKRRLDHPELG